MHKSFHPTIRVDLNVQQQLLAGLEEEEDGERARSPTQETVSILTRSLYLGFICGLLSLSRL